jgi:hypothetical protein
MRGGDKFAGDRSIEQLFWSYLATLKLNRALRRLQAPKKPDKVPAENEEEEEEGERFSAGIGSLTRLWRLTWRRRRGKVHPSESDLSEVRRAKDALATALAEVGEVALRLEREGRRLEAAEMKLRPTSVQLARGRVSEERRLQHSKALRRLTSHRRDAELVLLLKQVRSNSRSNSSSFAGI